MKKGFYASLAVGVIAITAVGIIAAQNTKSQEQPEHLAQIEEQAANTPETKAPEIEKPEAEITEVEAPETKVPESQEPVSQKEQPEENKEPEAEKQPKKETAPEVSQVMSGADSVKNLSFKEEEGLIWPVVGDVLLKYSMDKSIYFKTLAQYKVNPAVVIAAKEDTEVLSAAKCVVTDVSESEETGVTLTATLGDGYEVVYGQLKEVKAKVGDTIERGSVIGKIAKPTKYYVAEGTNLYFAVLQDGKPVDPLLLLE
ncbi:M23 family metallopeptidase [Acetivibrio ethanolgignens]|uniref:M23ase beta-sheet core domain-containing protein n=1 Tax=Acetivibrio ethanolgignens TaxID=290052 RepID=A0A0V8QCG7_9FIRM|nr:M23 family metallopeptidase [Acetivibrio ethanolgignens]KSV58094.1 hypothetical protein ASU35_03415 [Acetivibrio ethanolgignens]